MNDKAMTDHPDLFFDPTRCFIGGQWVVPNGQETLPLENPSTGEVIGEIARGRPAASAIFANAIAVRHASSAGFSTAALPIASAPVTERPMICIG